MYVSVDRLSSGALSFASNCSQNGLRCELEFNTEERRVQLGINLREHCGAIRSHRQRAPL